MVVVKNIGPELPHILAKLLNMCLEEYCVPDYWKVSSVIALFKNAEENAGERCIVKNY